MAGKAVAGKLEEFSPVLTQAHSALTDLYNVGTMIAQMVILS